MTTLDELNKHLVKLFQEVENYKKKGTKASSKRIRKYLGEIKNSTPALRKTLLRADAEETIAD